MFAGGGDSLAGIAATVDATGIRATLAFPSLPQPEPLLLSTITPIGLPTTTTLGNVQIDPNAINTFNTTITAPPVVPGTTPPIITSIKEGINTTDGTGPYPEVVLKGTDFTTPNPGQTAPAISDLLVVFQMPGPDGVREEVTPSASSTSTELHAKIPNDIVVGLCDITVMRPDAINVRDENDDIVHQTSPTYSNIAQLAPTGQYVFVAEPEVSYQPGYVTGAVLVLNGDPNAKNTDMSSAFNQVVASIPLGNPATTPNPIQVAVTPDNTRAYVTEYGNGSVAVIDALSLQEVNVNSGKKPSSQPFNAADWNVDGVRLDPDIDGDLITTATDVIGTVNVSDLTSWKLTLTSGATGQVYAPPLSQNPSQEVIGMVLTSLDPTAYPNGWYNLKLEATQTTGEVAETDIWLDLEASPVQKAIHLPGASAPYGIAIDPQGHYAYVVDGLPHLVNGERTTFLYQIDIDPGSPSYNEVVNTIQLGQSDSQADTAQKQIAPTGGRQVAVSADGLHVYVTAPNYFFNSDPTNPPQNLDPNNPPPNGSLQNGNLIEINLTDPGDGTPPTVSSIDAIPGSEATYGVATIPGTNDVIFTNAESVIGAEVTHSDAGNKQTIPFELDQDSTANQQLISVHSPNGVAVYTYTNPITKQPETYAFVAGRADVVDEKFFISQDDSPLYQGGNVGIIKDPYGPNPQLITGTRPIPDSYPTYLALSADGQYLYVSYQGLGVQVRPPKVDANGNLLLDAHGFPVDDGLAYGGIMVFNAQEIVNAIDNPDNQKYVDLSTHQLLDQPNPYSVSLFSLLGIDDLYVTPGATDLSQVYRKLNTAIDVQSQYDLHTAYVYDNNGNPVYSAPGVQATQTVFGIPFDDSHLGQSNSNGPIGLGVRPGGIAIQNGPIPTPEILQPIARPTGSTPPAASGGATPPGYEETAQLNLETEVDTTAGEVYPGAVNFDFTIGIQDPYVTLTIDGKYLKNVTIVDLNNPSNKTVWATSKDMKIDAAQAEEVFQTVLRVDTDPNNPLNTPGPHFFNLTVVTPSRTRQVSGVVQSDIVKYEGVPVNHTFVDGVDLADGHLTAASTDVSIAGPGPALQFTRSYSGGNAVSIAGPLGPGWTDNYNVFLKLDVTTLLTTSSILTLVGGDGSGDTFRLGSSEQDAAKAALYGLPADQAHFFTPQAGYHDTLVQLSGTPDEYDLYTKDGTRYHFKLVGAEQGAQPVDGSIFQLRFIEDLNGNRINLFYTQADVNPGASSGSLPGDVYDKLDSEPKQIANGIYQDKLEVVADSFGRALIFGYKMIAGTWRITTLNGYDPDGTSLERLNVLYGYDNTTGDLTNVQVQNYVAALGTFSAARTQKYTYATNANGAAHQMLSYTDPNGNTTKYEYYPSTGQVQVIQPASDVNQTLVSYLKIAPTERIYKVTQPISSGQTAVTQFDYQLTQNTVTVTDPDKNSTTYTLDQFGLVTTIVDPLGQKTQFNWSAGDGILLTTQKTAKDLLLMDRIDPLGQDIHYDFDAMGNVTKQIVYFASGPGVAPVTDKYGNPSGVVEADTIYAYDPKFNKVTSVTDAETHTTTYNYDPSGNGNLLSVTDALTHTVKYAYDSQGKLLTLTNADLNPTAFTGYDDYGDPTEVSDPLGNVTTNTYDTRGRLIEQSDDFGHHVTYIYDGLDRLISKTTFSSGSTGTTDTYVYYPGGQVSSQTDGLGHVTVFAYDQSNRLTSQTEMNVHQADGSIEDPNVLQKTFQYDANGNLTSEMDPGKIVKTYGYDKLNRVTMTTVGINGATSEVVDQKSYDPIGHVTADIDLHNNTTTYVYDGLYRLVQTILPAGNGTSAYTEQDSYNLVGHKTMERNANGVDTIYQYDNTYHLTRVISAAQSLQEQVAYAYDNAGNNTDETDTVGGVVTHAFHYVYDPLNRVTVQTESVYGSGTPVVYSTTWTYTDADNSVEIKDPNGIKTDEVRNGLDQLVSHTVDTSGLSLTTTYSYDGNGNLSTVTDPLSSAPDETYTYDGLNRLIKIVYAPAAGDSGPVQETYLYNDAQNQVIHTDRRSIVFTTQYDALHRVLSETVNETLTGAGNVTLTSSSYGDLANTVTVYDANHNATLTQYDGLGRPLQVTDALMQTVDYAYDGVNKTSMVDVHGNKTTYQYDDLNRLTLQTEYDSTGKLQSTLQFQYDDAKLQVTEIDRNTITTVEQYDSRGHLLSETRAGALQEQDQYDGDGNKTLTIDADLNRTRYQYDGANRLTQMTVGENSNVSGSTQYAYDRAGNLTLVTDPFSHTTSYGYDARYRRTSMADGANDVTVYAFDNNNNVTSMTDPLKANDVTTYAYDELNKLLSVDESARGGSKTYYQYDNDRNLSLTTDALGHATAYAFDALNRVTKVTEDGGVNGPLNWLTAYASPSGGKSPDQETLTDPLQQVTVESFDYLGRLANISYTTTNTVNYQVVSMAYGYDGNGNLLTATEVKLVSGVPVAEVTNNHYDSFDRLTNTTNYDAKTIQYKYDAAGNQTAVIDSDNVETDYSYDARNRLSSVTTGANSTKYDYWPNDLLKSVTDPNGVVAAYTYDLANRLTQVIDQTAGGTLISSYQYAYDANGNRKSQLEQHSDTAINNGQPFTTTYAYDALNRLTSVTYGNGGTLTYNYDAVGNRKSAVLGTTVNLTYEYDNGNRLTRVIDHVTGKDSVTYSYDLDGNRTFSSTSSSGNLVITFYFYNARNELVNTEVTTTQPNAPSIHTTVRFDYDFDGNRVKQISQTDSTGVNITTSTYYLIDGANTLLEYDGVTKATVRRYENGVNLVSLTDVSGTTRTTFYYVLDGLGSVSELTGSLGSVQAAYQYDAWGNLLASDASSDNLKGFTGQDITPAIEVYDFGARYYDSTTSTFLSEDSYAGDINVPATLNRYNYAQSNPLKYTDPTGHLAVLATAGIGAAVGAIGGGIIGAINAKPGDEVSGFFKGAAVGAVAGGLAGLTLGASLAVSAELFGAAAAAEAAPVFSIVAGQVGGFTGGFGNALVQGKGLNDALLGGVSGGLVGGISAAVALPFGALGGALGGQVARSLSFCEIGVSTATTLSEGAVAGASGDLASQSLNVLLGQQSHVNWWQVGVGGGVGFVGATASIAAESSSGLQNVLDVFTGDVCFAAGTLVAVPPSDAERAARVFSGRKKIEDLVAGDLVLSRDEVSGERAWKRVQRIFRRTSDHCLHVTIRGAGEETPQMIRTTDEHPFWVPQSGWVRAGDLREGTPLLQADGNSAVLLASHRELHPDGLTVYNMEVEDYRTYFVASTGAPSAAFCVHNSCFTPEQLALFQAGKDFEALTGKQLDVMARRFQNVEIFPDVVFQEFEVLHQVHVEPIIGYTKNGQPIYGNKIILDHLIVGIDEFNEAYPISVIEDKLTAHSPLTENQANGYPGIIKNGFRVVSPKYDATIEYGTIQPPTEVLVIRGNRKYAVPFDYLPQKIKSGPKEEGSVTVTGTAPASPVDDIATSSLILAAQHLWAATVPGASSLLIDVVFQDLPNGELGESQIDTVTPDGLPAVGTIVLSPDAAGLGWFLDATPQDNSEFGTQFDSDAFGATSNSPAAGEYDLFTVLLHEEAHLLGFNPAIPGYAAHVGTVDGSQLFTAPAFSAQLTPDDDHLDSTAYPYDLMDSVLEPGVRRLPSPLDVQIIDAARGTSRANGLGSTHSMAASGTTDSTGLIGTYLPERQGASNADNIINGTFAITNPTDPNFGWTPRGSVMVANNQGVLSENPNVFSELSQSFIIPANATALRFTVYSQFCPNPIGPPDAFEAALLNANTGISVVNGPTNLAQTDAFFNLQSSDQTFFSPETQVAGVANSGNTAPAGGPLVVTLSLAGVAPGTAVTLDLDLLSFGPICSQVEIANVQLLGPDGNHVPVANPESYTTPLNQTLVVNAANGVLTNDTDLENDPLTAQIVTQPASGTVTLNPNGSFTYTPATNFSGTVSFTYTASDGQLSSQPAQVTVNIGGGLLPPLVVNHSYGTLEDVPLLVPASTGVLFHATDPQALPLSAVLVVGPTHGIVNLAADGSFGYIPTADYSGTDSFTYMAYDSALDSNIGTVNLTIAAFVNHVPSFSAGANQSVNENAGTQTVTSWATAISAGPSNESGQHLNFQISTDNDSLFATGGLPSIDPTTGTLTYTPATNAFGIAHVALKLHDDGGTANNGQDTSAAQNFIITVNFVNHPPSFTAGAMQTVNENAVAQTVSGWATAISAGPSNESGQHLNFQISTDNDSLFASGGLPAIDPSTGTLTYTPATNAFGIAHVTLKLHDDGGTANNGQDTSAVQTFTITVGIVNQAPSFTGGADQTVNEEAARPAQTLRAVGPDNGGQDTSAPQTFTITVNFVNQSPSFNAGANQTVNVNAGVQTVTGWATGISAGPASESGQHLNFLISTDNDTLFATGGLPSIDPSTGTLIYTPATNAFGIAHITLKLHDDGGTANNGQDTSAAQNFSITVQQNVFTPITISGTVYRDIDQNGSRDPSEPTLSGWNIQLFLNDSSTALTTAMTDGTGTYSFPNLGPGVYRVREASQPGWQQTSTNPADITAVSGVNVSGVNFGDRVLSVPAVVPAAIRDNSQLLYTDVGGWKSVTGAGWNNNYRSVTNSGVGTGGKTAMWTLRPPPGVYEVYVSYPASAANAANASYTILNGSTVLGTVVRNQQLVPGDATYGGVTWVSLGVFNFSGTGATVNLTVSLSDQGTTGTLIADGVMAVVFSGGSPQVAASLGAGAAPIAAEVLASVVTEAETLWRASGLTAEQQAALNGAHVALGQLPSGIVGTTSGENVTIDPTAAGNGWFVGPAGSNVFLADGAEMLAVPGSAAADHMDLLTVVVHELGHVLGYEDADNAAHPGDVMDVTLADGIRRLPPAAPPTPASLPQATYGVAIDATAPPTLLWIPDRVTFDQPAVEAHSLSEEKLDVFFAAQLILDEKENASAFVQPAPWAVVDALLGAGQGWRAGVFDPPAVVGVAFDKPLGAVRADATAVAEPLVDRESLDQQVAALADDRHDRIDSEIVPPDKAAPDSGTSLREWPWE